MAKVEIQKIRPFSNGTEFMMWQEDNCDRCVKAFRPKGEEMPSFHATRKLVNLGMECEIKFHVDMSAIDGEMSLEIAQKAGYTEEKGFPWNCLLFSDNDDDGWKPTPRRPKDAPDCQLCLPFAINEIVGSEHLQLVEQD